MTIKDLVKDQQKSDFMYCFDGALWYKTRDHDFLFPVPLNEVKGGTYNAEMKSITLMRFIRKHFETLEQV